MCAQHQQGLQKSRGAHLVSRNQPFDKAQYAVKPLAIFGRLTVRFIVTPPAVSIRAPRDEQVHDDAQDDESDCAGGVVERGIWPAGECSSSCRQRDDPAAAGGESWERHPKSEPSHVPNRAEPLSPQAWRHTIMRGRDGWTNHAAAIGNRAADPVLVPKNLLG